MSINMVVQAGVMKSPALRYGPDGKPEFRFTLVQPEKDWQVFLPCCSPGAATVCDEERCRSESLIRPGTQSVRNCSTGGHWQNFCAPASDVSHTPMSYFYTYLGCTRTPAIGRLRFSPMR
jgi:hypothetical protein